MYHSVTIGSKNTYTDWHLVPDSRPVIAMPEVKSNTIEIPGRNGVLDLTEAITHYPVYNNREGELKFHVLNDKPITWISLKDKISKYLHGKRLKMFLEDQPNWYYEGRFSLKEWTSNNDGTWSDIIIAYDLDPYKLAEYSVMNARWLWDPFSFVDGVINDSEFKKIPVTSANYTKFNLKEKIGQMPVTPTLYVTSTSGVDVRFYNAELGINLIKTGLKTGTYTWPEIILTEVNEENEVFMQYKKTSSSGANSTISLDYREGAL